MPKRCCPRRFTPVSLPWCNCHGFPCPVPPRLCSAVGRHMGRHMHPPCRMKWQCLALVWRSCLQLVCHLRCASASPRQRWKLSTLCLVLHPLVITPLKSSSVLAAAQLPWPRAYGRCDRCPPGSGVMFDMYTFWVAFTFKNSAVSAATTDDEALFRP